jgi:hypothetical protein
LNIIDYDQIDIWGAWLDEIISEITSIDLKERIKQAKPKYIEDAGEIVFEVIVQENLANLLSTRLNDYQVRVYHGTRLSEYELKSIRTEGLRPLLLKERKATLVSIFSSHANWPKVKFRLDEVLEAFGRGNQAGHREDNCIHVCFSREGLISSCNHYLTHGAEVDGHVANSLFGSDNTALALLQEGRKPYLLSFIRSFEEAVKAANPFGVSDGEVSSLLRLLIEAWAYRQCDPVSNPAKLKDCTAAMFQGRVEPSELEKFELLSDDMLKKQM